MSPNSKKPKPLFILPKSYFDKTKSSFDEFSKRPPTPYYPPGTSRGSGSMSANPAKLLTELSAAKARDEERAKAEAEKKGAGAGKGEKKKK
ncbi:hypothetical protein SMACR_06988 [Sordaria macrospora]|uniref:WGS project CABT00000000 data, contig 2.29 n=2 Tax=Sordaria macrospora TaxID=5147 RepID=F7W4Z3_SORMK|nr:uncharacterized protein SMAC_06988 [Sordaria macrospora k-hell]KAA8624262.1 hypothetical protein SMACR_06988 [Sordaria macrospora]WPJ67190.1 hypothetical protein SMAC4_06988 [Sordaria macrospora]CCC12581.1 unnamed protein product [Sordaria macrospora k-hell]